MRRDKFNERAEGKFLPAVPSDMPALYVTSRRADADWSNWRGLTPDIVMPAIGRRFITYDIRDSQDFKFTDQHRDGYACGFETLPYHSFSHFWGPDPHDLETTMFRVRLKHAQDIYVVDEQPFLDLREEKWATRKSKNRKASERDVTEVFSAIAKTMIPLHDYQRNFDRPIYLIGRHLRADEAQVFVPAFKQRLLQKELARQARMAADTSLIDELFGKKSPPKEDPAPPPVPKSSHLHLVIDNQP